MLRAENVPAAHKAHDADELAPETLLYAPGAQDVQALAAEPPPRVAYVPQLHRAQTEAPACGLKVPTGQVVQSLAPGVLYAPAAQAVHPRVPVVTEV